MGPVTLYQDNTSTMALVARGKPGAERTRHIDIRHEQGGRHRTYGDGRNVRERTHEAAARSAVRLRETVPYRMDR